MKPSAAPLAHYALKLWHKPTKAKNLQAKARRKAARS